MTRRILAFCLSVMMLLSALPVQAFATETVTEPTVAETTVQTVPTEESIQTELPVPETTAAPAETVPETQATVPATEETAPEVIPEETAAPTVPEETVSEETVPEETFLEVPEEIVSAPAAASGTYGDLSWNYEDGTLTVSGTGAMTEGDYPWSSLTGEVTTLVVEEGVASIAVNAFLGFTSLTSVTLPGSLKTIGIAAFANCAQLAEIVIPEGVETIDFVAFQECCNLTTVTLPLSLTVINGHAFRECAINDVYYAGTAQQWAAITIGEYNEALTEAIIHFGDGTNQESTKPTWSIENGVLTISGTGAMEDYSVAPWHSQLGSIHTVVVGEGITYIGANAFRGMTALTAVTLPETLTEIGMYAFSGCTGLASVTLPKSLTVIGVGAFSGCNKLEVIDIPENVTSIEDAAFSECGALTEVVLPAGIRTIGDFAFQDCDITHVYYRGSDLEWCSVVIGAGNENLTDADINFAQVTGSSTGKCGDNLTWITADGVLTISGTGDMYNYTGESPWLNTARTIRVLTVEEGVTSIGDFALASCMSLTTVTLPSTLKTIGTCAFSTCSALTEITIPEGVTAIGDAAFIDCSKLTTLTLPASLASIGLCAFSDPPLATVYYGANEDAWNAMDIAEENTALDLATRFYADGAIAGTWGSNLRWNLKDGVLTVSGTGDMKSGSAMPWNTYKDTIHTVIIEDGVTSLPANAFSMYQKLTKLTLPGTLKRIGDGAFATCAALTEVVLPEGLETIGAAVFIDCGHLTTVHLPATLKTVGDFAFRDCPLTDVYYAGTENNWEQVSVGMENEDLLSATFHFLSGPADYTMYAGKALTLTVINPDINKAYSAKQISWSLAEEFEPFASMKGNKLTAKKVFETVRVVAVGTIAATGETVSYKVDIYPVLTSLQVLDSEGGNVSGKTLLMDYTEKELTLTADVLPETMSKVTWTVSDKKNTYAEDYKIDGETLTIAGPKGKAGTVTIKATAEAGTKKTVTVKVAFGSYAKTVVMAEPEKDTIRSGETLVLSAAITEPETVTKAGIVWSVSNTKLASVSAGKLKAKTVSHPEIVTVTATSKDGCASASIDITILPKNEGQLVLVSGSKFVTNTTVALNEGDTMPLTAAVVTNGESVAETVTWTSAKEAVATVSADGTVTAVAPGTAKITAEAADGRKASFTVKVSTLVKDMTLTTKDGKNLAKEDGEFVVVVASGKSVNLVAYVLTEGASSAVTWEIVEGSQYAKLSAAGKFTANKDLTKPVYVTVKATAKDGSGYAETLRVKIRPIATGVQIFEGGSRVRSNTTYVCDMLTSPVLKLSARVFPANAIQSVVLTSSNKKIADFVDGELVCYKPGTVTITATAQDGSNQKATFKLTVVKKIQDIRLSDGLKLDADGAYVLAGGKSLKLPGIVTVAPADATNKKLSWRVADNDAGVTVTPTGTLKAPKVTAPVTVSVWGQAQDGSGQDIAFNVRIYPAVTRVILEKQTADGWEAVTGKTVEVKAGESLQLRSVLEPDGCFTAVTWKSSNDGYAEVSEDGLVTAVTAGKTATITCTAADGSGKKAIVKIKVVE